MGEVGFALRTELKCGRSLRKLGFALRRVEVWKKSSPIVFPNPRVTIMRGFVLPVSFSFCSSLFGIEFGIEFHILEHSATCFSSGLLY